MISNKPSLRYRLARWLYPDVFELVVDQRRTVAALRTQGEARERVLAGLQAASESQQRDISKLLRRLYDRSTSAEKELLVRAYGHPLA